MTVNLGLQGGGGGGGGSPISLQGTAGTQYSGYTFNATGGTPPYTYSISSGSADGLSLDPSSGVLSGTPTAAGTFPFTVTYVDKYDPSGSVNCSLAIANEPPLTFKETTLPIAVTGNSYSATIQASGGSGYYNYSIKSSQDGISISGPTQDTASCTLTGTPESVGTYTIIIYATDYYNNSCQGSTSFTLTAIQEPLVSTSWYVAGDWWNYYNNYNNLQNGSPFYNTGLSIGSENPSGYEFILDFGAMQYDSTTQVWGFSCYDIYGGATQEDPDGYVPFTSNDPTQPTIQGDIESVLNGYNSTNPTAPLTIIVGTNTSGMDSNPSWNYSQAADQFYGMLKTIAQGCPDVIEAGIDIETCSGFSSPTNVLPYVGEFSNEGINNNYKIPIWDFGAFLGTPSSGYGDGWTAYDFYLVNWGDEDAYPYPELYDGPPADTGTNDWGVDNALLDAYCSSQSNATNISNGYYSKPSYGYWSQMGVLTTVGEYEGASQAFVDQLNDLYAEQIPSSDQNIVEYNSRFQSE